MYVEMQGTQNSPDNLEEEKQSWRTHMFQFQILLESYFDQ